MRREITLALLLAVCAAGEARAQNAPQVRVQLGSPRVYLGESVEYTVTVINAENPQPPEVPQGEGYAIEFVRQQSSQMNFSFSINGRQSARVQSSVIYLYRITPSQAGELVIPAPKADVGGATVEGEAITLRVVAPEKQDVVILEIAADRQAVYPTQSFHVTLNVAVKGLPEPSEDRNPVTVQTEPPQMRLPWAMDESLPDGIEPKTDWRTWLRDKQDPRGRGFQIEGIGSSTISFFSRAVAFQPEPRQSLRQDAGGQLTRYWEYSFVREFTAVTPGDYNFGPVSLRGTFAVPGTEGQIVGRDIYTIAEPLVVHVKPVPSEARPDSFTGAIGEFTWNADLTPSELRVGDPLTLTLTMTGQGTLDAATPPDLSAVEGIGEHFKLYEGTAETRGRSRRFTYSLRPLSVEATQFPPVPISYFDVERERYVTLMTEPIPLTVHEAERLAAGDIIAAGPGQDESGLESRSGGIFANITDTSQLADERVVTGRWLAAWGGMAGAYFSAVLVGGWIRRRHADPAAVKRRTAPTRARERLQAALAEIERGEIKSGCLQVRDAYAGLIADVTGAPQAGLTPRDVEDHLRNTNVSEELAAQVRSLLEQCDNARYGMVTDQPATLADEARTLLAQVLQRWKAERIPT